MPVEFNVAEIFFPINPLLPTPQITIFPLALKIESTTLQNSFPIDFSNDINDSASSLIVFRAILIIRECSLNLNFFDSKQEYEAWFESQAGASKAKGAAMKIERRRRDAKKTRISTAIANPCFV